MREEIFNQIEEEIPKTSSKCKPDDPQYQPEALRQKALLNTEKRMAKLVKKTRKKSDFKLLAVGYGAKTNLKFLIQENDDFPRWYPKSGCPGGKAMKALATEVEMEWNFQQQCKRWQSIPGLITCYEVPDDNRSWAVCQCGLAVHKNCVGITTKAELLAWKCAVCVRWASNRTSE